MIDTIQTINPFSVVADAIQYFWTGIIGFITGLIILVGFWKKTLKPYLDDNRIRRERLSNSIDKIEKLSESIKGIRTDVIAIRSETQFNGGTVKLRDVVAEISNNIKTIKNERDAMIQMNNEPMFKNDNNGHLIMANSALCEIYGVDEDRLLGYGWYSYIAEEDKANLLAVSKLIKDSTSEMTGLFSVVNQRTKEVIPLRYRSVNVKDDKGDLLCVIGKVERV